MTQSAPASRPFRGRRLLVRIMAVAGVIALLTAAVMGAYVVKSALGINVFTGRSPVLHDLLFPVAMTLKTVIKTAGTV